MISSSASMALPETRLGIIPGAGGTYRLPAITGIAHALDLVLTGSRINYVDIIKMKLAKKTWLHNQEFKFESMLDPKAKREFTLMRTLEVARQIARGAPLALGAVLRAMTGPGGPSEVAENVAYDSLLHSEDRKEALTAFGEKRSAVFKGR